MSWRSELLETEGAFSRLRERVKNASTGDRGADVAAALLQLYGHIVEAEQLVEAAELQHRIDQANLSRERAEQRLAELSSAK